MTRLLLDNSVLQRLSRAPAIVAAVHERIEQGDVLCSCPTLALEAGFSARNMTDHAGIIERLTIDFDLLPFAPEVGDLAIDLQRSLFESGQGRAVGVVDLLTAATAVWHDASVLHYDGDFERVAAVDSRVRQQWVVPRGSVD
jgi:predicted nucleic acid-binding protein